jgi:hypothetical protein
MKIRLKVVLTLTVIIIPMFAINLIKNADSEYNLGLFIIIVIAGSISGVITIWSNNPENLDAN